jgi:aminoglycoside phosphotransferase (APT) family kinase protein
VPSQREPDPHALALLVRRADAGLRLLRAWPLPAESSRVTAVEAAGPDGTLRRLVVREYCEEGQAAAARPAGLESEVLQLMSAAGVPVPGPRYADDSCLLLPAPCLVMDLVDGQPPGQPADLAAFTTGFASTLAGIHRAGVTAPARLPDMTQTAAGKLARTPGTPDATLSEGRIRAALAANWPPPQRNQAVLLHGDYWPGNTLWRDSTLVAVIDWDHAVAGDPLADLANGRLEVAMLFGQHALRAFTGSYLARQPGLDLTALPHWDLYAALRPAGNMAGWGLEPGRLASMRAAHLDFTEQALGRLAGLAAG